MSMSREDYLFFVKVRSRWANGQTQQVIAEELGIGLTTLRDRLRDRYGLKFGRAGRLIPVRFPRVRTAA